jgi:hypothetical protein
VGGSLGGLLGTLIGVLAPKGKGRAFVLGAMWFFILLGVGSVGLGLYALAVGQPYAIWFGPILTGVIPVLVMGSLLAVVRIRYREAEERHLQSEGFRAS